MASCRLSPGPSTRSSLPHWALASRVTQIRPCRTLSTLADWARKDMACPAASCQAPRRTAGGTGTGRVRREMDDERTVAVMVFSLAQLLQKGAVARFGNE